MLTKEPCAYTVGEILSAAEGSLAPISCVEENSGCEKMHRCPTYSFWEGLNRVINEYLDSTTLEDIVKEELTKQTAHEVIK